MKWKIRTRGYRGGDVNLVISPGPAWCGDIEDGIVAEFEYVTDEEFSGGFVLDREQFLTMCREMLEAEAAARDWCDATRGGVSDGNDRN